ncbi:ribosomal protein L17 [Decorospora gaudefroyi]|uniref:Large ribosomal subunit protein bL17m n=1 Tax=Decorospora gaudefroyi TaxID=184978 RepID=A0A6A5KNG6_9PLEO|nr:ribosomal protein L17 [Decorospora gaudefroyi]
MAGGHMKYRHLSRSSSHRQALLRNLVTSLFKHESISTTWHKAKEAQRLAEKLVTLGKKNTEATRRRATQIFFEPNELVPKLFGPIRERYANRPGGYTRVLRIEPMKEDQAESAILELVDGPKDMRFAMTAKTLAHYGSRKFFAPGIARSVKQVTQFRENGIQELQSLISRMRVVDRLDKDRILAGPRKVYPEEKMKRDMHYFEEVDEGVRPNKLAPGRPRRRPRAMLTGREQKGKQDVVVEGRKEGSPSQKRQETA